MFDLSQIVEVFNNRELALGIWSFIFLFIALLSKQIRELFNSLISIFLIKEVGITLLLFFSYIGSLSYLFHSIGFWELELMKETILWTLFVGLILIGKFSKEENQNKIFKTVLTDSLTIILVLEFIIDTYVFSFWNEIFLVAGVSILALIEVVLKLNKDSKKAHKFVEKLLSIIGLIVLGFAIYYTILDIENFLTIGTLKSFIYPVILTILSLPFFYIFVLILKYDSIFNRIKNKTEEEKLKWKAKYIIFKHCLFSLSKLQKANEAIFYNLYMIKSDEDLKELDEAYQKHLQ